MDQYMPKYITAPRLEQEFPEANEQFTKCPDFGEKILDKAQ
jgi:hypothetical protein